MRPGRVPEGLKDRPGIPVGRGMMFLWRTREGFTLLETLVALAVLCVGFLAVAGVMVGTQRGRSFSAAATGAVVCAQDKMEEMMRVGYTGLPSVDWSSSEDYGAIVDYPRFKRVVTVAAAHPAAGMKTVAVTVYWRSDRHAVSLETILVQ